METLNSFKYTAKMLASVKQSEFAEAIKEASRFTAARAQIPVLGNILLRTYKTKLFLESTNLEASYSTFIGAQVKKEGALALPGRELSELVSGMGDTVDIKSKGESALLTSGQFEAKLAGVNPSDFPSVINAVDNATPLPENFTSALAKTTFSVSRDESRPILTGVLFEAKDGVLNIVSTDGFRLSLVTHPLESKAEYSYIVPVSVLSEISRIATSKRINFEPRDTERQVLFEINGRIISSRVIEGTFPSYEERIPKDARVTILMSKQDLLKAVKMSSVFARDGGNTITIDVGEKGLEVTAESQRGSLENLVVEGKVKGEPLTIKFNYRFLEEALNVISGENVELALEDESSPAVLKDPEDKSFVHLVMPVRG